MTDLRTHLGRLADADDLVTVDERVHWADTAAAVAREAARGNAPAIRLSDTGGRATLVAGAFGGPDRLAVRAREPWARIGAAVGAGHDAGYLDVLDGLAAARRGGSVPERADAPAATAEADLRSLGLPAAGGADAPAITLGVAALPAAAVGDGAVGADAPTRVPDGDRTAPEAAAWVPVRGSVHGSDGLALSVPAPAGRVPAGTRVTVALGAPPAALLGATMRWLGESHTAGAPAIADALRPVPIAPTPAGAVPAGSEVLVEATVSPTPPSGSTAAGRPAGRPAAWERAVPTATLDARATRVRVREDPLIPFSPTGAAMADDRHLLSVAESARLYGRVNNYWGVSPAEWLALPVEAGLGICLVAADVLYAGFEWQLANTLFSFSHLFDKVVIVEAETPPMDLGRAFDDLWVKAHPANDWEFSDPEAPAARAPRYRQDGTTGANVYVDAAWDPQWDEEYIAPRVTFDATYPEEVREAVRDEWHDLGFDHGPEYDPTRRGDGGGGA